MVFNDEGVKKSTLPLANIHEFEGEVLIIREGLSLNAKVGHEVLKFDRILTPAGSHVTLNFITQDQVRFGENSEVLLKLWDNSSHTLPIYAVVRRGWGEITKSGKQNQLILENPSALLTSLTATPLNIRSTENVDELDNEERIPSDKVNNIADTTPLSPKKSVISGATTILSNQDISAVVLSYLKPLQKCQLNAYNFQQQATGQLTVRFSILPAGKTEGISIQADNTESEKMAICVKSVFERIKFPPFDGSTIAVNYPLRFE